MATSTVENYLKAILHLQRETGGTTVGEVAKHLDVTPGTVTTMMRHLSDRELVDYIPRRGLRLRATGEHEALKVVRRHRLIESFLVQVMKLDWSEVHEEAEILEHVISERLLDKIDAMLGHPTHDPHGDPIPDRDGKLPECEALALSEVTAGNYRLARVSDDDPTLLEWLDQKCLAIGDPIRLAHPDRAAGVLEVSREDGTTISIGERVASQIYVGPVNGE